mmetsp:Transcript_5875/g.19411  ORF Transcript_5875/g.19411 Transcript_5875/m.19411 type:complete len:1361 (-) Transcript_5875:2562-6644(-)
MPERQRPGAEHEAAGRGARRRQLGDLLQGRRTREGHPHLRGDDEPRGRRVPGEPRRRRRLATGEARDPALLRRLPAHGRADGAPDRDARADGRVARRGQLLPADAGAAALRRRRRRRLHARLLHGRRHGRGAAAQQPPRRRRAERGRRLRALPAGRRQVRRGERTRRRGRGRADHPRLRRHVGGHAGGLRLRPERAAARRRAGRRRRARAAPRDARRLRGRGDAAGAQAHVQRDAPLQGGLRHGELRRRDALRREPADVVADARADDVGADGGGPEGQERAHGLRRRRQPGPARPLRARRHLHLRRHPPRGGAPRRPPRRGEARGRPAERREDRPADVAPPRGPRGPGPPPRRDLDRARGRPPRHPRGPVPAPVHRLGDGRRRHVRQVRRRAVGGRHEGRVPRGLPQADGRAHGRAHARHAVPPRPLAGPGLWRHDSDGLFEGPARQEGHGPRQRRRARARRAAHVRALLHGLRSRHERRRRHLALPVHLGRRPHLRRGPAPRRRRRRAPRRPPAPRQRRVREPPLQGVLRLHGHLLRRRDAQGGGPVRRQPRLARGRRRPRRSRRPRLPLGRRALRVRDARPLRRVPAGRVLRLRGRALGRRRLAHPPRARDDLRLPRDLRVLRLRVGGRQGPLRFVPVPLVQGGAARRRRRRRRRHLRGARGRRGRHRRGGLPPELRPRLRLPAQAQAGDGRLPRRRALRAVEDGRRPSSRPASPQNLRSRQGLRRHHALRRGAAAGPAERPRLLLRLRGHGQQGRELRRDGPRPKGHDDGLGPHLPEVDGAEPLDPRPHAGELPGRGPRRPQRVPRPRRLGPGVVLHDEPRRAPRVLRPGPDAQGLARRPLRHGLLHGRGLRADARADVPADGGAHKPAVRGAHARARLQADALPDLFADEALHHRIPQRRGLLLARGLARVVPRPRLRRPQRPEARLLLRLRLRVIGRPPLQGQRALRRRRRLRDDGDGRQVLRGLRRARGFGARPRLQAPGHRVHARLRRGVRDLPRQRQPGLRAEHVADAGAVAHGPRHGPPEEGQGVAARDPDPHGSRRGLPEQRRARRAGHAHARVHGPEPRPEWLDGRPALPGRARLHVRAGVPAGRLGPRHGRRFQQDRLRERRQREQDGGHGEGRHVHDPRGHRAGRRLPVHGAGPRRDVRHAAALQGRRGRQVLRVRPGLRLLRRRLLRADAPPVAPTDAAADDAAADGRDGRLRPRAAVVDRREAGDRGPQGHGAPRPRRRRRAPLRLRRGHGHAGAERLRLQRRAEHPGDAPRDRRALRVVRRVPRLRLRRALGPRGGDGLQGLLPARRRVRARRRRLLRRLLRRVYAAAVAGAVARVEGADAAADAPGPQRRRRCGARALAGRRG